MATNYPNTSPWANTKSKSNYLNYFEIRSVPASDDDILYEVESRFTHRPDLLSYELYKTTKLWWVFAQRNMEVIKDPVFDLVPGIQIYLPQGPSLYRLLGV
jgi:hypothetical protein